jgi:hypothetical protein
MSRRKTEVSANQVGEKEIKWEGPRYQKGQQRAPIIVAEYDDKMEGKVIPDDRVVRANNRRWLMPNEVENFELKSTPRCPTYGVCSHCFGSGPVHMLCQKCRKEGHRYIIAKRDEKFLDAEWVSRFFGTSHLDVRADKTQNWRTQQIWMMSEIELQVYMQCRWSAGKLLKEEDLKYWFKCMQLFDDGVRANGAGIWDAIENPVKILRWDNPNMYRGGDENED